MHDGAPAFDGDRTQVVLRPGLRCFGRYTLTRKLGQGGMGVVWLARDEKLQRDVALKFLPEQVREDPEALQDLTHEVRRCLDLTHVNVVRVYDFVEDAAAAAISMEYVPGATLAARKVANPAGCFDAGELAPLVTQLCAALEFAHTSAKIVHRDLKPANLLVTDEGVLKIADFGIARSLSETKTRLTSDLRGTAATLSFASPQQLAGAKPAATDDLYSLGATLYDLLTGKPPFFRGDVLRQIETARPQPLAARRAELEKTGAPIPAAWEETILACLAKRAEDRPASAAEVARLLTRVEASAGENESDPDVTQPIPVRAPAPPPPPPRVAVEIPAVRSMEARRESLPPPVAASKPREPAPRSLPAGAQGKGWARKTWGAAGGVAFVTAVLALVFWPRGSRAPANGADRLQPQKARPAEPLATSVSQPPEMKSNPQPPAVNTASRATLAGAIDLRLAGVTAEMAPQVVAQIDDKPATLGIVRDLPEGQHTVTVTHPAYDAFTRSVAVRSGETTSVEARLAPKPATLFLVVSGPPAYVLRVNGAVAAVTDGRAFVPAQQELALEISAEGYEPATRTLTPAPYDVVPWNAVLTKRPAATVRSAPAAEAPPSGRKFTDAQLSEEFGWFVGKRVGLPELKLSPAEFACVERGLRSALAGRPSPFDLEKVGPVMDWFIQKRAPNTNTSGPKTVAEVNGTPANAGDFTALQLFEEFGWFVGKRIGLGELDWGGVESSVFLGLERAMKNGDSPYSIEEAGPEMDEWMKTKQAASQRRLGEVNERAAQEFYSRLLQNPKVQALPSGLFYEVIRPGKGAPPKETDTVRVEYSGTLIDGTAFDQSKAPIEFKLTDVIPGWTEGMQKISPGGVIKLYIPARLGYGDEGRPGIPPKSILIFEVTLHAILPGQ